MSVAAPGVLFTNQLPVSPVHLSSRPRTLSSSSSSDSQRSILTTGKPHDFPAGAVDESSHYGVPRRGTLRRKLSRLRNSIFRSKAKTEASKIPKPDANHDDLSKDSHHMIPSVQVLGDTSLEGPHKGVICQPSIQVLHGTLVPESDDEACLKRSTSAPDLSLHEDLERGSFRSESIQPNISDPTPTSTSNVDLHEDVDDLSNKNFETSIGVSTTDLEQSEVLRSDGLDPNPIPIPNLELNQNVAHSEDQNSDTSMKIPTKIPASASSSDVPSHLSGSGEIPYCRIAMFALVAGFCVVAVPHTCRLLRSR